MSFPLTCPCLCLRSKSCLMARWTSSRSGKNLQNMDRIVFPKSFYTKIIFFFTCRWARTGCPARSRWGLARRRLGHPRQSCRFPPLRHRRCGGPPRRIRPGKKAFQNKLYWLYGKVHSKFSLYRRIEVPPSLPPPPPPPAPPVKVGGRGPPEN